VAHEEYFVDDYGGVVGFADVDRRERIKDQRRFAAAMIGSSCTSLGSALATIRIKPMSPIEIGV
jgi:hypothetical protein